MNKTINNIEEYISDKKYVYSKRQGLINIFKKIELWERVSGVKVENWTKEFLIDLCKNRIKLK